MWKQLTGTSFDMKLTAGTAGRTWSTKHFSVTSEIGDCPRTPRIRGCEGQHYTENPGAICEKNVWRRLYCKEK